MRTVQESVLKSRENGKSMFQLAFTALKFQRRDWECWMRLGFLFGQLGETCQSVSDGFEEAW